MRVEIRNLKHIESMSEETQCFSCVVYVDGKKAGTASNHGHGGPTMIHPRELEERLEAYARTLPPCDLASIGMPGETVDMCAEILIGDLVEETLCQRRLSRDMSRAVLFTKINQQGVFTLKPRKGDTVARLLRVLESFPAQRERFAMDKILNTLPVADAIRIAKENEAA